QGGLHLFTGLGGGQLGFELLTLGRGGGLLGAGAQGGLFLLSAASFLGVPGGLLGGFPGAGFARGGRAALGLPAYLVGAPDGELAGVLGDLHGAARAVGDVLGFLLVAQALLGFLEALDGLLEGVGGEVVGVQSARDLHGVAGLIEVERDAFG